MSIKDLQLDKYQLYFNKDKKKYIEFSSEKIRNCNDIYNLYRKEIEAQLNEIYGKENNNKFNFILIESKINNKSDNSLIELKLNPRKNITNYLNSKLYYLCYLPVNNPNININLKKSKRNKIEEMTDKYIGVELESLLTHNLEKYLVNEGVYWFDKTNIEFIKGKGNIDEKVIEVSTKKYKIKLKINAIRKEEYYENKIPPILEGIKVKIPNYIIIIYHNNVSHIFGLYQQKSYLIWKKAIKLARIKFSNFYVHSIFNSNITTYNYQHFIRSQSITKKLFTMKEIMENPEKRQIFLEEFSDKKIAGIISNIYSYKNNINNNEYFEAWIFLKQISFHIDFNNINDEEQKKKEIKKYSKIFTQERINTFNNIAKKADDVMEQIKNIEGYEEELNKVLKDIFEINLFDKLYNEIYELYIEPNFKKMQKKINDEFNFDNKPKIVRKFHLLTSKYCAKFFDFKNINNFNCLCSSYSSNNILNNDDKNISNYINNKKRRYSNYSSQKNLKIYKTINTSNSSKSLLNEKNDNIQKDNIQKDNIQKDNIQKDNNNNNNP